MAALIFYGFSGFLLLAAAGVILCRNSIHAVLCLILAFFNGAGIFLFLGAELISMVLVIVYVGAVAVLFLFAVMMIDGQEGGEKDPTAAVTSPLSFRNRLRALGFFLRRMSLYLLLGLVFAILLEWGAETWDLTIQWSGFRLCIWGVSLILALIFFKFLSKESLWDQGKNALESLPVAAIVGIVIGAELIFIIARWPSSHPNLDLTRPAHQISNAHQIGRILYTDYIFAFQSVGIILLIAMIGAIVLTFRSRGIRRVQNPKDQMARTKKDSVELRHMPIGGGV